MQKFLCILLLLLSGILLFAENKPDEEQRKFDYFFLEALRLKQKEKHSDAFNILQYALKIDSTSSAALYEIYRYYLFLKKEKSASDALKKAILYNPDNDEYKLALANLNNRLGQLDEAIALYEKLAKENPEKTELHYYLSSLYIQQQNMDKAVEALNSLENNVGINETISLQKYQLYKLMNRKNEALKEIENLAAKFPTEAKYQIITGDFYLEGNKPEEALSYYERAAKIDPDDPFYFISMANYYEYKKQDEAATQEIEKALKNPVLDSDTKLGILGRYIQNIRNTKKDIETANMLFETLTEQHSQDKELNVMYGQFLLSQGKTDEAKFQFQVVTETTPENIAAWTLLLDITLKEENTDEIISICNGALLYFPDVPEFYFYKGMACFLQEEYQMALDVYKKGLEVINEDNKTLISNFLGQIADVYYQQGNKDEAFSYYDKALRYNEKNIMVMNNYAYYLSLAKENLDKAERMSATVVQLQPDNATYIDTYAWIFFQKGNYSLAKFYIESALSKNDAPNGDILEHYGDILYKTGNIEKAVSEWEKALLLKEDKEDTKILKEKIANKTYYE
ncbi:MAG: tetratricopeptide repeat protein [Dysgonamonadaceae bacterium]|jgi:tetratricopeptide (TPR) repeat protein|nr:tetratricopeptide repeat protein [Dysgonamonadaceae bacterium]